MVLSDCKEVIPTDTVGTRIRDARKASGKTQKDFAAGLGMSENFIWQIEKGQREPSDRTVSDICRVYGINEVWLRTGVGEMKLPMPLDQQLAQIFADVQISDDERARLVKAFASLPPEAYPQLYKWFLSFMENLGK
nr:MAG TPA_asm: helix-turn-helix domain protein [Caudoviricetes sp.]